MRVGVRAASAGGSGVRPKAAGSRHNGMGVLGTAALWDRLGLCSNGWQGSGMPLSTELGAVSRRRLTRDSHRASLDQDEIVHQAPTSRASCVCGPKK